MSVRTGSVITVAGRNVVDRLQSAAMSGQTPIETIREVGNDLVVGLVPGESDFTFALESWDVSTDLMAFLHGEVGDMTAGNAPGHADPAGTEYRWSDCQFVNLASVWKRNTGPQGGDIAAGMALPGYYPTRMTYNYGVAANAAQTVDLNGGEFYLAQRAAVEEVAAIAAGALRVVTTSEAARPHRLGGPAGTTFDYVWGVLVNGQLQVEGEDYNVTGGAVPPAASTPVTITFTRDLVVGDQVKFIYFTETDKAYPQAVHADTIIKPAAVRGRNIVINVGPDGSQVRLPGIQTFAMTANSSGSAEREMGVPGITGRQVDGTDVTGTITARSKDIATFFATMQDILGVDTNAEVVGYFNETLTPLEVQIQDPLNPGNTLKTLYVAEAQFQPPAETFRVNTAIDHPLNFAAANGDFSEFKGARP